MKKTARQTRLKTLADLYRAIDRQHAVTITYRDDKGVETIRTIEITDIRTSQVTIKKDGTIKGGDIYVIAMCRLRAAELADRQAAGEDVSEKTAAREFALSDISSYTVHRMAYVLTPPANTTYQPTPKAPADSETAIVLFELERDPDDADYRPRVRLAA